jgi:hypothetical protein
MTQSDIQKMRKYLEIKLIDIDERDSYIKILQENSII